MLECGAGEQLPPRACAVELGYVSPDPPHRSIAEAFSIAREEPPSELSAIARTWCWIARLDPGPFRPRRPSTLSNHHPTHQFDLRAEGLYV
jgi:hypothetical protein